MATPPPFLPEEALGRVVRTASLNGRSLFIFGGAFAILFALHHDIVGALCACAASGSGAMQLHGAQLLLRGLYQGYPWLTRGLLVFVASAFAFCVLRFRQFDLQEAMRLITPETQQRLRDSQIDPEHIARLSNWIANSTMALTALVYALLLLRYYSRRRKALITALSE